MDPEGEELHGSGGHLIASSISERRAVKVEPCNSLPLGKQKLATESKLALIQLAAKRPHYNWCSPQ